VQALYKLAPAGAGAAAAGVACMKPGPACNQQQESAAGVSSAARPSHSAAIKKQQTGIRTVAFDRPPTAWEALVDRIVSSTLSLLLVTALCLLLVQFCSHSRPCQ
jgi:hypothetical protein